MCALCLQVVSSRLQMTQGLLQKTAEEQGASEAIGDKLCKKAVCLMDDISALADRYYIASGALKIVFIGQLSVCQTCRETTPSQPLQASYIYF